MGENCDVTIVAGCGIHNGGSAESEHSDIHAFYVGKNAKVKYIEKHFAQGDGSGKRTMNPTTLVHLGEGAYMEMETAQLGGVDSTIRTTNAELADGASLVIHEKILTHGSQRAETHFNVNLNGEQLIKLMTLGLTEKEAEEQIISGFLK